MLPMTNPIAFTLFGLDIRWYAIIMASAILCGLIMLLYRSPAWGLSKDSMLDYFIWLIPFSILGARLYYVAFEWSYYSVHPAEILAIRNGGMAIHGSIIAGLIVTVIFCKVKKINPFKLMDLVIPSVALGQGIGRWGNYFNMEAHGVETTLPWAIPVREAGRIIYVHPTFLYESIWDILVMFFLLWYEKHHEKRYGQGFCLYLILYSAGRFFIEGLRTDSLMFLGLRQAQLISLAMIAAGIAGYFILRKKGELLRTEKL
ncbi:MAG: prolipoprotein diacylglyceryl transferase [Eubacteriaceae bacterium]|jgi:phosphatidylglycerol:prolipoprotein diacylglycerol transferase